ncbi:MAG: hypothetical protein MUF23_07070, partial [Pirellula sp.]|nr:hypothetical protein [Pirellula sp.]
MRFLRHYIQILVPLLVGFAAYHFWIVPYLEPKSPKQVSHLVHHQKPTRTNLKWWEAYFVEGAWQRNNPLVIERDQSILLYKEREQISDTRWRFKPLTIVIPQSTADGGKKAIFIENPKGAEIQFKTPFDWATGQPPPVVNGQLLGDIKIYAPADDSSASGELLIETRDMRIDKRQVWTTEPIQMRLGSSTIEGRYLSIYMDRDLLADAASTSAADASPFAGLDYLELFYVDRVDMALKPGGLWPSQRHPGSQLQPATASLKCGGTFVFQFHQSLATLKNGVHMEHRVEGLPVDTFDCQELKLTLGLPNAGPVPSPTAPPESNRWRIDRIEATGAPGRDINDQTNWVRMLAPGMQAEANGQHLIMDFIHGMVTLSNALPGTAPRNSSRVYLKRESLQISSPQVQFQNADLIRTSGEPTIKRLGWVVADGIGIAQMDTPQELWSMRWSKRLVIRPHEERDLIQIEGGANVSSSLRGRFIAETLNMWVLPVEGALAQRLAPHFEGEKLPEFVPDAIAANGDVMVNSPELQAQVESVAIRFRYPDLPANTPPIEPRGIELQPSTPASPATVAQSTPPTMSTASFDNSSSRSPRDNGTQPG